MRYAALLIALGSLAAEAARAGTIADTYELAVTPSPLDLVAAGEDVAYDTWMAGYRAAAEAEPRMSARLIPGAKTAQGITYGPRQVRAGGIDLGRLAEVRQRGAAVGLFVVDGEVWVKVDEAGAPPTPPPRVAGDIGVLVRAAYESPHRAAWLTIDPPPDEEARRQYGLVRYGGGIEDTHVGMVLFEADRLLKCLSIGFDNRTGAAIRPGDWHRSEWDFVPAEYLERRVLRQTQWRRYWFTTEEAAVEVDGAHRMVRLCGPPLTVKTEQMQISGADLAPSGEEDPGRRWTGYFNDHLAEYEAAYPVLQELDELARWAALLSGLKEAGVLLSQVELSGAYRAPTPIRTPVVTATKTRRLEEDEAPGVTVKRTREVTIFGGVGLDQVKLVSTDLAAVREAWLAERDAGGPTVARLF
ncbi:MAG: hypothetical protein ABIL09_12740 [Gemmatimonadota bacterium]